MLGMKKLSLMLAALTLVACGSSSATPGSDDATPTIRPSSTPPLSFATETPQPGFTLIPNNTSTPKLPTDTPVPCVNDAVFISDLTIPDNSEVIPGAPIDKRWQIQNTGTCNWNGNYRLAFFEGNQMGAAGEHAIFPAKAGAEANLQVNMIAPDLPGDYTGRWQLRDPEGRPFGPVLFIKIVVIQLIPPTATVAPR
jgi:hypothetical protein